MFWIKNVIKTSLDFLIISWLNCGATWVQHGSHNPFKLHKKSTPSCITFLVHCWIIPYCFLLDFKHLFFGVEKTNMLKIKTNNATTAHCRNSKKFKNHMFFSVLGYVGNVLCTKLAPKIDYKSIPKSMTTGIPCGSISQTNFWMDFGPIFASKIDPRSI